MGDIIFFIKMVVMSFVFVVFLQIKIGDHTLEERAKQAVVQSSYVAPLQEVAHGGVVAIRQGWRYLTGAVGGKFNEAFDSSNSPGNRGFNIELKRSKEYIKDQVAKAKHKAQALAEEAKDKALEEMAEQAAKQKGHLEDDLLEELKNEGYQSE